MKRQPARRLPNTLLLAATLIGSAASAAPDGDWFENGKNHVRAAKALTADTGKAHNIILFIGDGMGVSTVTAARILDGQKRGQSGEENQLSFERFPYLALSKTYNTNQQTPDSAGSMSAIMTGEKTRAGVVAVNRHSRRNECKGAENTSLQTFLELAENRGKATGVVTTTRLTHATPAATYAHSPQRRWEGDSKLSPEAIEHGCKDMAAQLIDFNQGNGIEVALGGGRRYFTPENRNDPELTDKKGERKDGRDLIGEWQRKHPKGRYVWNAAQFNDVDVTHTEQLLGLFSYSHMHYDSDRKLDVAGEPSLDQMTAKAIEMLQKNKTGYFLVVEGGRIDHAHHAGNAYRALHDTIAFAEAVATARDMTASNDTLIIVTADHSHVFTLAGYPTRGNPILGKVVGNNAFGEAEHSEKLAADGLPYTTLGYQNGPGYAFDDVFELTSKRRSPVSGRDDDLTDIDTEDQRFHQQSLVPLSSETHGGEDVAVYADGPGAYLVRGVIEQHVIYHIMREAMGL